MFIVGWVGLCLLRLSLAAAHRGYSSWGVRAPHCSSFSWCGAQAPGTQAQQLQLPSSRAQAQSLWHKGLIAPKHVGSSQTRDQTRVSFTGRRILYHWTTREAQSWGYLKQTLFRHWRQVQKTFSKPDAEWCRKFLFEALGWIWHSHC